MFSIKPNTTPSTATITSGPFSTRPAAEAAATALLGTKYDQPGYGNVVITSVQVIEDDD